MRIKQLKLLKININNGSTSSLALAASIKALETILNRRPNDICCRFTWLCCRKYQTSLHWRKKGNCKFRKQKANKVVNEPGFVLKIWEKYGVIGLGLLGTMSVGAPISIGIGVGFNVPTNKMVFWCSLGVLLRCAIFTAIGYFSLQLI